LKNKLIITTLEEYYLCRSRGIDPLFWHFHIKLDISLRISIQNKLFGHTTLSKKNIPQANDKYYHYCYNYGPLVCENCGDSLYRNRNILGSYSATYISHILSRSNKPEMAHDPRNFNKLCAKCHDKWESQKKNEMLIFMDNQIIIKELLKDYS